MAKFIAGPIVGEIRNALGAQVFTRGAHGPFSRERVSPDATVTDRRDTTQVIWAEVADRWNTALTDSQRAAWHQWAISSLDSKSPLTPKALIGRNAFFRINQRLGLYGATYLDEPAWEQQVEQISLLELAADVDAQSLLLTFSPNPLPAFHAMSIEATKNLNLGRSSGQGEYRFIAYLDPGATSPVALHTYWLAKKWRDTTPHTWATQTIQPGKKIFARARLLNLTNGAYSVNQVAVATATGTGDAMLTKTVHLTASQIKNLYATPVEIIPPPGINKALFYNNALFHKIAGTTPYSTGSGAYLILGMTNNPKNLGIAAAGMSSTDILDTAEARLYYFGPQAMGYFTATQFPNQPIYISKFESPELDDGDSEADITVTYTIIDV